VAAAEYRPGRHRAGRRGHLVRPGAGRGRTEEEVRRAGRGEAPGCTTRGRGLFLLRVAERKEVRRDAPRLIGGSGENR
jgi:hypothetical protein